jgi:hypothetical protein
MVAHRTWRLRIVLALIATLLLTGCTTQASSPGRLVINDETERLKNAHVAEVAAPLLQRGATVAIFIVERGDNNGDDLSERLTGVGLRGYMGNRIVPDAIAIYVSYQPRYSELRAGRNWSGALSSEALRNIRTNALNPALRNGDVTAGVVETLKRFESALAWRDVSKNLPFFGIVIIIGAAVVVTVRDMLRGNFDSYHTSWCWSNSSDASWSDSSSSSSSWSDSSSSSSSRSDSSGSDSSRSGGSW